MIHCQTLIHAMRLRKRSHSSPVSSGFSISFSVSTLEILEIKLGTWEILCERGKEQRNGFVVVRKI